MDDRIQAIYRAIEASPMNIWVGGGDPRASAMQNWQVVAGNIDLRREARVLDFGCGIGRTAAALLEHMPEGQIVGVDLSPAMIAFCQQQFITFPNVRFYCTAAENPLYATQAATEGAPRTREDELMREYAGHFDAVVAFSVFTHFDPPMAARYLAGLRSVLDIGGRAVLTWFFDHPSNPPHARLSDGAEFLESKKYPPLQLALFSPNLAAQLVARAGFVLERLSFGYWRFGEAARGLRTQHYQDALVLRAG